MAMEPHIVSLVLQSKKALQYGEQLCTKAKNISNSSAQSAVDVLAVDAKVRWVTDAIVEQLKLATNIAKTIEEKRTRLAKQVKQWDDVRSEKTDALDKILEDLGSQRVPPHFYQTADDSSLFGSQHSEDKDLQNGHVAHSPSDTLRVPPEQKAKLDKMSWKTLRDFVDDHAIEDILETMENDRNALDGILGKTDQFPETLMNTITSIRESLPADEPFPAIESALVSQDHILTSMAQHLESLASHYDQMANALKDSEAGEVFGEDDIREMNRDTDELPSIMSELEESVASINSTLESLDAMHKSGLNHVERLTTALGDLDELGDIMTDMLSTQESVETACNDRLAALQENLTILEQFHERFVYYQAAFNKLVIEIARRRLYTESAETIVRGMMGQLEAMTEEERLVREHFNAEHGAHLPEDICLCIANPPTRWQVIPAAGDSLEVLPDLDAIVIDEARTRLGSGESAADTDSM